MSDAKPWWRIELDAKGVVLSSQVVEEAKRRSAESSSVYYVQATDIKHAKRAAYNAHSRELVRDRRARYELEGLCRCGRERDAEGKRCNRCLERNRLHQQRNDARKRGEVVEPLDRSTTLRERAAEKRTASRLEVLLEVERHWLDAAKPDDFQVWISREILKLRGVKAA